MGDFRLTEYEPRQGVKSRIYQLKCHSCGERLWRANSLTRAICFKCKREKVNSYAKKYRQRKENSVE